MARFRTVLRKKKTIASEWGSRLHLDQRVENSLLPLPAVSVFCSSSVFPEKQSNKKEKQVELA